ncbi:uncharacterized protein BJ171DRAFT_497189 [Polychytrium aggregatum]|uniref:uncharacterized protein n=1 Tax=Polychytrium aggregatum TaxID=110093 RepID=UPI0022FDB4F7|nr:uncharacterized protein BJ171DRAFT_497189 [Polychytrium aggregatum]KAI9206293.1 hypothetical protein BJ171DRAFT_497189 [Polychytrium aggregatum]
MSIILTGTAWYATYKSVTDTFQSESLRAKVKSVSPVLQTAIAGASAGLIHGLASIPFGTPIIPETFKEADWYPKKSSRLVLKSTIGHSVFFLTYEGLRSPLIKAFHNSYKPYDPSSPANYRPGDLDSMMLPGHFLAGGIAGLAYRVATLPLHNIATLSQHGHGIILQSFFVSGALMLAISTVESGMIFGNDGWWTKRAD